MSLSEAIGLTGVIALLIGGHVFWIGGTVRDFIRWKMPWEVAASITVMLAVDFFLAAGILSGMGK